MMSPEFVFHSLQTFSVGIEFLKIRDASVLLKSWSDKITSIYFILIHFFLSETKLMSKDFGHISVITRRT